MFTPDGKRLLGGMLVGDTADYAKLLMMSKSDDELDCDADELVHGKVAPSSEGASEFADAMQVCSCNNVTKRELVVAIVAGELSTVPEVSAATKAGKGCGGCVPMVTDILGVELAKRGDKSCNYLCPHFEYSRAELCHIIKVKELKVKEQSSSDLHIHTTLTVMPPPADICGRAQRLRHRRLRM